MQPLLRLFRLIRYPLIGFLAGATCINFYLIFSQETSIQEYPSDSLRLFAIYTEQLATPHTGDTETWKQTYHFIGPNGLHLKPYDYKHINNGNVLDGFVSEEQDSDGFHDGISGRKPNPEGWILDIPKKELYVKYTITAFSAFQREATRLCEQSLTQRVNQR